MSGKVTLRTEEAHETIRANLQLLPTSIFDNTDPNASKRLIDSTRRLIDEFEVLPKLLDLLLQTYISSITKVYLDVKDEKIELRMPNLGNDIASLVLSLAKVRGYKFIATFFSTDVYLFRKVLDLIFSEVGSRNNDECYFLLLWLSNLVLVPFKLEAISGSIAARVSCIANKFINLHTSASRTQTVALLVLARLFTRADCTALFSEYTESAKLAWPDCNDESKLGYLMTFNQILKRASNVEAQSFAYIIYNDIILHDLYCLVLSDMKSVNTANVRILIKVSSKVSRYHVKSLQWEKVAEMVDILLYIAGAMKERFDTSLRECLAKSISRLVAFLSISAEKYANQLVEFMLKRIGSDTNIDQIWIEEAINDGRLTIPLCHTVLLFCGFLAINKLFPRKNIPALLSLTHQTSFLSYHTTGSYQYSQLRDASCLCMWALLKSLSSEDYKFIMTSDTKAFANLFIDLIKITIFDEDLTIRRCGSAVLQEFIGRFGSMFFPSVFPHISDVKVGALSIRLVELFDTNYIGTVASSFKLVHDMVALGLPKQIFVEKLIEEMSSDFCPFSVKQIVASTLCKVLNQSQMHSAELGGLEYSTDQVIESIVFQLQKRNYGALIALAELQLSNSLLYDIAKEVHGLVLSCEFDIHTDKSDKGESIIAWFVAAFKTNLDLEPAYMVSVALAISRLNLSDSLVKVFRQFFALSFEIDLNLFKEVCEQIKTGNNVLAKSVLCQSLTESRLDLLIEIMLDKSIDAQTRAYLVQELREVLSEFESYETLQFAILSLLDDYTISSQGDVGLLIRLACIDLLKGSQTFLSAIKEDAARKLWRIAGETLDKLRIASISCICEINHDDSTKSEFLMFQNNYGIYFEKLLQYASETSADESSRICLWSGIVKSAGALVAGADLINMAFRNVLAQFETENGATQTLGALTRLLRLPDGKTFNVLLPQEKKTIMGALNVWAKLLDAEVTVPTSFNFEGLYIRAYNLHINTLQNSRIGVVIRIFQHLSSRLDVPKTLRERTRKRLQWLAIKAPTDISRAMALDALFELVIELDPGNSLLEMIDDVDSSTRMSVLQDIKSVLKEL